MEMIQQIVVFEELPENKEIVLRRKKLWEYIRQLQKDNYLSKYIIFDG